MVNDPTKTEWGTRCSNDALVASAVNSVLGLEPGGVRSIRHFVAKAALIHPQSLNPLELSSYKLKSDYSVNQVASLILNLSLLHSNLRNKIERKE